MKNPIVTKYVIIDTSSMAIVSRHRTLKSAVKKQVLTQKFIARNNGRKVLAKVAPITVMYEAKPGHLNVVPEGIREYMALVKSVAAVL
jgi:hypothetical protein